MYQTIAQRIANDAQNRFPGKQLFAEVELGSENLTTYEPIEFHSAPAFQGSTTKADTVQPWDATLNVGQSPLTEELHNAVQNVIDTNEAIDVKVVYYVKSFPQAAGASSSPADEKEATGSELTFKGQPNATSSYPFLSFRCDQEPTVKVGKGTV